MKYNRHGRTMLGLKAVLIVLLFALIIEQGLYHGIKSGRPISGLMVALALVAAMVVAYVGFLFLAVRWRPPLPKCKTGKCTRFEDYHYLMTKNGEKIYRCNCGIEYGLSSDESRLNVKENDQEIPYMRHDRFGRWKPVQ